MVHEKTTSISVTRDMRNQLYYLKRPADSWDDMFERLLAEADVDPQPPAMQWAEADG